ncbi:hypothetical protein PR048_007450 [Dryococelus australis]|uniref:Uncharacterized protein n=1 Tax=Dryococelus australis TaxID=614101 RepID=A0ABQ9HUD5_9NEOP|nr:hypothetical protein PR048_007450 [Dryococelus australis]
MERQSVLSHAKGPKHIKKCSNDVPSLPSCSSHTSDSSMPDSSCSSSASVLQQTNVKYFAVNEDDVTISRNIVGTGHS